MTSVLDGFAPITLLDGILPFLSPYRPLWLGLGALAFDLLIALAVTSLLRRRLGYRSWRAIHWLAYASWPVAVLHGLGTGTDTKLWWMLALTAACAAAVLAAVLVRIARARPAQDGLRTSAAILGLAAPVGIAIFTLAGPLQSGWARRAGTPANLLGHRPTPVAARGPAPVRSLNAPFSAELRGDLKQTAHPGGSIVDLALRLSGGASGRLRIRLAGAPLGGGGLSLVGSQVDLLAVGLPSVMQGKVLSLQGQEFLARVTGSDGSTLDLHANLHIDTGSATVTGTMRATTPAGG